MQDYAGQFVKTKMLMKHSNRYRYQHAKADDKVRHFRRADYYRISHLWVIADRRADLQ